MTIPDNNQSREFTIRSTVFDRPRRLLIDQNFLEFNDQTLKSQQPTRFTTAQIESLRYGIKPIRGMKFRIGRIYCIDIRDTSGRIIKLRLKSIYRINLRGLEAKYKTILDDLVQTYFSDIARRYVAEVKEGRTIQLLGVSINNLGVMFEHTLGRVGWNFLNTKTYWHYYTIYSEENPEKYRSFVHLEDWNSMVLRAIIEHFKKRL